MTKEKNKGGRPKITFDWDLFDNLCDIQATKSEIAGVLEISEDTIERRIKEEKGISFADYYKRVSSGGKSSLRRAQMKTALSGNATMQIWLGKQFLDQKDTVHQTMSGPGGGPIQTQKVEPVITDDMSEKDAAQTYSKIIKDD